MRAELSKQAHGLQDKLFTARCHMNWEGWPEEKRPLLDSGQNNTPVACSSLAAAIDESFEPSALLTGREQRDALDVLMWRRLEMDHELIQKSKRAGVVGTGIGFYHIDLGLKYCLSSDLKELK